MQTWKTQRGYTISKVLSGRSNVFLLSSGKQHLLVDSGIKHRWRELEQQLDSLGVKQIDFLILTHSHFDHAGNAAAIQRKYHAAVFVHAAEADYLKAGLSPFPQGSILPARILIRLAKLFGVNFRFEPCPEVHPVEQTLDLGVYGLNVQILPTPGHTLGSVSVLVDHEVALVGDAMFGVFPHSVFPPFANDTGQMIKSWGILLNSSCSVFLPAHGTAVGRELLQKQYLRGKKNNGPLILQSNCRDMFY